MLRKISDVGKEAQLEEGLNHIKKIFIISTSILKSRVFWVVRPCWVML